MGIELTNSSLISQLVNRYTKSDDQNYIEVIKSVVKIDIREITEQSLIKYLGVF